MNTLQSLPGRVSAQAVLENRFGLRVAARLSQGAAHLPHDIEERLRAAREQAIARRKQPAAVAVHAPKLAPAAWRNGNAAVLGGGGEPGWWGGLGMALTAVVLAAGLFAIQAVSDDKRASEVAEVDAALLTDDLPPQAYADPGFLQFLKTPTPVSGTAPASR